MCRILYPTGVIDMMKKITAILMFVLVSSVLLQSTMAVSSTPTWGVKKGDSITWQVKSAPNATFIWWDINTGAVKVNVTNGSLIKLNITKVGPDDVYGDFSMGNLTAKNVSMTTIGFNIIIGVWPFVLGPVVPTNMWDNITAKAKEANVQTVKEDSMKVYLGLPRDTIEFANTTKSKGSFDLVFDKSSGILLYCYGQFGKYSMTFEITETTVNLQISGQAMTLGIGTIVGVIAVVVVIAFLKKRR